jgi:hypothetical protein
MIRRVGIFLACLLPALVASAAGLQALIDATPAGGTLRLAPGRHAGPVTITRALTLDGGGRASIVGSGRGTVLLVAASGVTLRGLRIAGSGESHDGVDAGILLQGDGHRVEDNRLDDVLFGIHLQGVHRQPASPATACTGKRLAVGLRGDAMRLWNSRGNRIEEQPLRARARPHADQLARQPLQRNRFDDGRYGMHVVFSPRLLDRGNRLSRTPAPASSCSIRRTWCHAARQPCRARADRRRCRHRRQGKPRRAGGRQRGAAQRGRPQARCAAGARGQAARCGTTASPTTSSACSSTARRAAIAFTDNRFENNLTTVGISAPGAGSGQRLARQLLGRLPGLRPRPRRHRRHAARGATCSPTASGWRTRSPLSSEIRRCWKCSIFSNAWRRSPPRTGFCATPRRA